MSETLYRVEDSYGEGPLEILEVAVARRSEKQVRVIASGVTSYRSQFTPGETERLFAPTREEALRRYIAAQRSSITAAEARIAQTRRRIDEAEAALAATEGEG